MEFALVRARISNVPFSMIINLIVFYGVINKVGPVVGFDMRQPTTTTAPNKP